MKRLFLIEDTLANKISYYHLLLLLASLPFDMFYSHVYLISFIIHTTIQFKKTYLKPVFTWQTLLLQSVFWVTVFSTIYTINRPAAFNEWGKQIAILLFPLVFCFTGFDLKKYRTNLLLGFSIACTLTTLYLYYDALHIVLHYKLPLSTIFLYSFTNHNFAEPIQMHATFLSMQLVIALVYMVSTVIKKVKPIIKIFYLFCALVLLAGVIQLCSKSTLFCAFAIITFAVPYSLLQGKTRWKFILVAAAVSVVAGVVMLSSTTFRDRIITTLQTDFTKPRAGELFDPRLARWETGLDLIVQKPIIGHGAGSELGLLHDAFFAKKYYNSFLNNLNVHSEYLSFLIKSGVIGLLCYISTLAFGFRAALQKKDLLFFSFILLIAVVSFSENMMDVDKGIFFYAFFFSFFIFSAAEKKRITIKLKGNQTAKQPVIMIDTNIKELAPD